MQNQQMLARFVGTHLDCLSIIIPILGLHFQRDYYIKVNAVIESRMLIVCTDWVWVGYGVNQVRIRRLDAITCS